MSDALSLFMANRELAASEAMVRFIETHVADDPEITVDALLAAARAQRDRDAATVRSMEQPGSPVKASLERVLSVHSLAG